MRGLVLTCCCVLAACAPPKLVDQDVSFVVPLEAAAAFLPASGGATGGDALVPRALFDRLQPLTVVDEPDALYAALATVAVRIDRCFTEGKDAQPCRPQVRLVLQPVFDSATGRTTRDAALHLFFAQSDADVSKLVHELSVLRTKLNVAVPQTLEGAHPGFSTPAWTTGALALLKPLLKRERIVRATSVRVHASNQAWIFAGVEVSGDQLTDIDIATLGTTAQNHVTSVGAKDHLELTIDPAPVAEPALPTVLKPDAQQAANPEAVSAAVTAVARLENPAVHNPGTVDCASCHVAATTRWFLNKQTPPLAVESPVSVGTVYADSRNLRAFGYFFSDVAISPRVQRETALVRADFAKHLEQ